MAVTLDQNELLFTTKFVRHKEYWIHKLAGDMAKTDIRLNIGNKHASAAARDNLEVAFPAPLIQRLIKVSKNSDLSLYIILLAGLKALTYRYTQNPDITVISPINKLKISPETLNDLLLLIRNQVRGDMTFKELILEIRQTVLEAHQNQDYPFDTLFEYLFNQPLVENNDFISSIVCSLINIHDEANIEDLTSRGKLALSFVRENGGIKGNIIYDSNAYEKNHVEQISYHLRYLLEDALEDVNKKCMEISFLSPEERKQLIYDFNNNHKNFPKDKILPRFIEEYADITPHAIAISFAGKTLTYGQLNEKANQLAGILRNKGVKRDQPVGIMLERSPIMVVSILAVWKAGGTYVPIEPDYPTERIRFILEGSQAGVLLTDFHTLETHSLTKAIIENHGDLPREEILKRIPGIAFVPGREGHQTRYNQQILLLDDMDQWLAQQPVTNLVPTNQSTDLAYIIFTSGSTGKPKGAMVEHIGMMNHIYAKVHDLFITGESVVAQNAAHTFDISVWQFFAALMQGGKAIIYPDQVILEPNRLINQVIADRVTILEVVPSYLSVMLDNLDLNPRTFTSLKYLLVTGEELKHNLVERWFEKYTGIKVVNAYGPTEASDDITHFIMDKPPQTEQVPIGKPLQNFNIYILDQQMNLCPVGVKGEICVSGVGVGRGYLNSQERTNAVFLQDPFTAKKPVNDKGLRLYKTGDIGCWLPDGNIVFVGRKDDQVKIRGFRIELAEIETQLLAHSAVKEAVVIDREDEQGSKSLCAYIVKNDETGVPEIKTHLARYLPDYMIPAHVVVLEKIPLTPNGKIDRKALAKIEPDTPNEYIAPRSAMEELLVSVMGSVLGRNQIRIDENFFEIGGDSIKAIQIASRMYKHGYKIEMRDIFENPIIMELAPKLTKLERIASQGIITGKFPLTPIQEEFFQKIRVHPHHNNQAVMLYAREGFTEEATRAVFKKIQEHHDALRMTYKKETGEFVQENHGLDYPFSLQVYDLRDMGTMEEALNTLQSKAEDIQASIDLEKGPLMKLGLFHFDDGDRLLIVIHHLVIDGVSWRILFEDIERLFQQYKNDEPFELPLKTDSLKRWSEKLQEYANHETFLKDKAYWAELEAAEFPGINKDFAEKNNDEKDADNLSFHLSADLTELLLTKVNEAFRTDINEILLTALGLAVCKVYHHKRLLIAFERHGREEILDQVNISRTVGWFTSVFPILLDFSYTHDMARQIIEIKEQIRKIPNNGITYGILKYLTKEEFKKEIDFRVNPQISFNYLGQFDADVEKVSFKVTRESTGISRSIYSPREYELELNGMISMGQFMMSLTYNKNQYKRETIQRLINCYREELIRIILYCSSREGAELTPSDLTYPGLSIEKLEQLKKQYPLKDIYVLSPMQEGMLFHALIEEGTSTYFEQISYRLKGHLDIVYVEKSLEELMKRYDILRTVFIYESLERPLQVVLKERYMGFFYQDISGIAGSGAVGDEKESYIKNFKEKDRQSPFDLGKDVLMRVSILKINTSEYEFIWSFHHILMDGWCLGILISEFSEVYSSLLGNRPDELPPVKPYRTYIEWLEKQDPQGSKNYWAAYLDHYVEAAGVPKTKGTRASFQEYKNQQFSFPLPKEKTANLDKLARKNQVTLNTILQTIWGVVLSMYCGKQDVVFGAVVSGRPAEIEGVESIVGLFINTIPVRIRYHAKTKFNQLLKKVQDDALNSEPHHHYPLSNIQSSTVLKNNLLDHLFIYENYPIAEQIDGLLKQRQKKQPAAALNVSDIDIFEQTNYDFNILIGPGIQTKIILRFNGNVYDREFVERIASHFTRVIDQVLANEEQYVDGFTLLSEQEKNQILVEFNDTKAEYPKAKSIQELFAEQVEKTPDHTSLLHKDGELTYKELDKKANQLARLLQEKNVTPGIIVAIKLERSVEMIIGILGILKAGAAYLPIEPGYPKDRMMYVLCDSNAGILLTTSSFREITRPGKAGVNADHNSTKEWQGEICFIDEELGTGSRHPGKIPGASNNHHPGSLAYIIYTSGSTGMPKGVMIEHHSVVNRINWMQTYYPLGERDVILQKTTFVFDVSVWELFWWFFNGASLSLLGPGDEKNPEAIIEAIEKYRVTTLHFVPSMLNAFLEYIRQERLDELTSLASLKQVFASGEALHVHQVETFNHLLHKTNGTRLINLYGPTEATVDVSYFNCPTGEALDIIPIGKPIDNIHLYIVDKNLHLQPIRVKGELCIAGVGLARGYLNKPELTVEKFCLRRPGGSFCKNRPLDPRKNFLLFTPHSPHSPYSPIYRTGDLARWLPDGNIEFLGRIDTQVKMRGFRIELGEIESLLLKRDEIKEAVVLLREIKNGNTVLCSYIVFEQKAKITVPQLKDYLAGDLPDYMVPTYFTELEKMPLTPNGKLDKKKLPPLEIKSSEIDAAPETDNEKIIARIWKEVLGLDQVGVNDNFFDLGGNSLLSIKIIGRFKEAFKKNIPIVTMYRYLTIRSFARFLEQDDSNESFAKKDRSEKISQGKNRLKQTMKLMSKK